MAKASADDAAAAHTNARIAILFIVERRGTRTDVGFGIRYLASKKQEQASLSEAMMFCLAASPVKYFTGFVLVLR